MSKRLKIAGKGALAVALVTGGAVAALALQPSSALAQKKYHMKIGMATINDPQQAWGERIGAELAKRTNGQITYQVFPASQLGKIPRQVEGIQLGTQEVFLTPPGFFVGVNQAFMVPDVPGLFQTQEHGHKTLTDPEFHDTFLGLAENKGVVGAGLIVYEGTSIASVKPIRRPEDISGMKIRVLATPMERAVPAAWGGTGVPIPFTEVVPALQRGVVDACRSSIVAMNGLKFQTVTKFATVLSGGYIPTGTWVSKAWANKLPADLRKMVLSVPRELEDSISEEVATLIESTQQAWRDAGVEIIRFSPADQKRYLAKLRPLGDKYLAKHKNPQVREIYALFRKVVEKHRPKS
jgi:TRAP-type C4-dicarboxylate transport system substrate-binding protein